MKTTTLSSLVIGVALSAFAPTSWAAGRGGGGGGGGFHGAGFGGGGFHGGGFRGGGFVGGARSFSSASRFSAAPNRGAMYALRSSGFRASGVSGRTHVGTNIPRMTQVEPRDRAGAAARQTTPSIESRTGARQSIAASTARSGAVAQQRGLNGRTDHIAERHN